MPRSESEKKLMHQHDLFHYFQQELTQIQQMLREFAIQHPKVAGRLRIGAHKIEDPQVSRLAQAFALSNAKLQHRLQDDLPELSHSMLELLAPHVLAPAPCLSIAQFKPNTKQLLSKLSIPRGTALNLKTPSEEFCHFRTCYDVELLPIHLQSAELIARPFQGPDLPSALSQEIKSVLHLTFSGNKTSHKWDTLEIDSLQLHIQSNAQHAFPLYDFLFQNIAFIALSEANTDAAPLLLDKSHFVPVGFEENEQLLNYSPQVDVPYRLFNDYAILPEKFLFFRLTGLANKLRQKFNQPGKPLHIWMYLKASSKKLEQTINISYFGLGCTPIINLFKKESVSIWPRPREFEYPLSIEGYKSSTSYEIISIEKMVATHEGIPALNLPSSNTLFSDKDAISYHAKRVPGWQTNTVYDEHGTEMLVSFTGDLDNWQVRAELLCTNRDLPAQASSNPDNISLILTDYKIEAVQSVNILMPFTSSIRSFQQSGFCWRYISHLNLHFHSIINEAESLVAFQDILHLYTYGSNRFLQTQIKGLQSIKCQQKTARNPDGGRSNVLWQGLEVTLTVDESSFEFNSLWLFSALLDRFLPLYCTQNAFTALVICSKTNPEYRWPLRCGAKPLL